MDREFRCAILAEAGAGKTEELRQRASVLAGRGKPAFFIRIEDIEADFYRALEIGEEAQFQTWLQSAEEAWFFLDSVDEARLENPRAFEKALRRFAKGIESGAHRAHVYLSSRTYAWRPREDRRLLDEILFLAAPQEGEGGEVIQQAEPQSALTVYTMRPLDEDRVRRLRHPLVFDAEIPHQITPKTSVKARCSLSNSPNLVINGRKRSSGMFGIGS